MLGCASKFVGFAFAFYREGITKQPAHTLFAQGRNKQPKDHPDASDEEPYEDGDDALSAYYNVAGGDNGGSDEDEGGLRRPRVKLQVREGGGELHCVRVYLTSGVLVLLGFMCARGWEGGCTYLHTCIVPMVA